MIYNVRPYGYYYQEVMRALTREPRLLIVGYGGRDPHLNELIYEYVNVHDDKRRPVAVIKIPGSDVGEWTSVRNMLDRVAGRGKFNSDFAYATVHADYVDAPRLRQVRDVLRRPAGARCGSRSLRSDVRLHHGEYALDMSCVRHRSPNASELFLTPTPSHTCNDPSGSARGGRLRDGGVERFTSAGESGVRAR